MQHEIASASLPEVSILPAASFSGVESLQDKWVPPGLPFAARSPKVAGLFRSTRNSFLSPRRQSQTERAVHRLRGHGQVMAAQSTLSNLAQATGQLDIAQDLAFFLGKPGWSRRTPHLMLLQRHGTRTASGHEDMEAALLVQELRPFGCPTGTFAVSDRSGRSVVFAQQQDRLELASEAGAQLLRSGANMVLLTIQSQAAPQVVRSVLGAQCRLGAQWAIRSRLHPSYFPIGESLDATLAGMGTRTRRNLRHYRRLADMELGCRFLSHVELTAQELVAFSQDSTFDLPEWVLHWRLAIQKQLHKPFLMGLQDRDGRWLSLVGGRRFHDSIEILWQLNRNGLQRHSLISAMRHYLLQHEVERGTKRLYIEGGTPHSMQHSFLQDEVTDLVLVRKRWKPGVTLLARKFIPQTNLLAEMLKDPATEWHDC